MKPALFAKGSDKSFSAEKAYFMALAANMAYLRGEEDNESWGRALGARLMNHGFFDVYPFAHNGTEGFVASCPEMILISFRGTESTKIEDLMTDANIIKVSAPLGGLCHQGFYQAASEVYYDHVGKPGIMSLLAKSLENCPNAAVWLTGHSLGAALATITTALLLESKRPVDGCYTFGSPRVGDTTFVENFNRAMKGCSYRLVNNNDLVTRVPPRSLGYSHVDDIAYLSEFCKISLNPSEWYIFLDRSLGALIDIVELGLDGGKDHKMDSGKDGYIPALESALGIQRK